MKSARNWIATKPKISAIAVAATTALKNASPALPVIWPTAIAVKAATSIMPSTATLRILARVVIIAASAASRIGVVCSNIEARNWAICAAVMPTPAASAAARS
jgi:hypothetical protein